MKSLHCVNRMAQSAQNSSIATINRKGIGDLLRKYDRSKSSDSIPIPIDCFFLQLSCPFLKWIDSLEKQKEIVEDITRIADNFLESKEIKDLKYGSWFRVEDGWPLMYFLDAHVHQTSYTKSKWFEFEEDLNTNVRQKLRKTMKEKDQSFRDMPIIIMRACRYVRDVDEPMDTTQ